MKQAGVHLRVQYLDPGSNHKARAVTCVVCNKRRDLPRKRANMFDLEFGEGLRINVCLSCLRSHKERVDNILEQFESRRTKAT